MNTIELRKFADNGANANIETLMVDPDLAATLLEGNKGNRHIRQWVIDSYAKEMVNGKWSVSESMICVSPDSRLLNGQHRLLAVVKSGVTVPMAIYWNCPEKAYAHMDTGSKRSTNDLLAHHGIINASGASAIARSILLFRASGKYSKHVNHLVVTNEEILNEYNKTPDLYQESVRLSRYSRHILIPSATGLIAYLALSKGQCKVAESFFLAISVSNIGDHEKGDPRRSLVEMVVNYNMRAKQKMPFENQANIIAKAYVAHTQGKKLLKLQWGENEGTVTL